METYKELLEEYGKIPHKIVEQTFMEICQVNADRFEEKCSKVLQFYLNPNNEHGFQGLFLNSLLETIGQRIPYDKASVKVLTEERTFDDKRIDITIISNSFVIAIENKINASLYNPFDSYSKYINTNYDNTERFFVLLSLRHITDPKEKNVLETPDYKYSIIYYEDLFAAIKSNMGQYILRSNTKYRTFLFDFIMTIENRMNDFTKEEEQFFYKNGTDVVKLIKSYERFVARNKEEHCQAITPIKDEISTRTGAAWSIYGGFDLMFTFNKDIGCDISLESSFHDANCDPLGSFHFTITYQRNDVQYYHDALMEKFGTCGDLSDRYELKLPTIYRSGSNDKEYNDNIINKLFEYYTALKEIVDKKKA